MSKQTAPIVALGLAIAAGAVALSPDARTALSNTFGGVLGDRLSVGQVKSIAERITSRHTPGVDPLMVRAMVEIESSRNPRAFRNEPHINDASIGLMQTLHRTAVWLHDAYGARAYGPPADPAALLDPDTSVYFGANYIEWLQSYGGRAKTEEWLVRSYNGGPGQFNPQTLNHWNKYQAAKARLMGS